MMTGGGEGMDSFVTESEQPGHRRMERRRKNKRPGRVYPEAERTVGGMSLPFRTGRCGLDARFGPGIDLVKVNDRKEEERSDEIQDQQDRKNLPKPCHYGHRRRNNVTNGCHNRKQSTPPHKKGLRMGAAGIKRCLTIMAQSNIF